jgi:hypothetical protein
MANAPQILSKSVSDRMKELMRALMVLRDAVQLVERGERHHMLPVFGLLRSLLAEKSRSNKPLLLDLASLLGKELYLYAFPGTDKDQFPTLSAPPVLRVGGLPVSLFQTNPHQLRLSVDEFLTQRMLVYNDRHYTRAEVIKMFAEKAGGAHFPERVPADFSAINAFEINGEPAIHNALLQLAHLTLAAGVELLRQLSDFSVYFTLVIPPDGLSKPSVLFDAAYPETSMRMWVALAPFSYLTFGVIGLDGIRAQVTSERLLNRTAPIHVSCRHHITDDLRSLLQIEADSEFIAETTSASPVFVTHDLTQYRRYINRSQEDPDAGFSFGFLEHFAFTGTLSLKDRLKLAKYMDEKDVADDTCLVFRPRSFGETAVGERDMKMSGEVMKWGWRRLVAGEWPPDSSANLNSRGDR